MLDGEKAESLKKELCEMIAEHGEHNSVSDVNRIHGYIWVKILIFTVRLRALLIKEGQFINSELVQILSNTISHMAEVMSNLQDSIAKNSRDFINLPKSPKSKAAQYSVNNLSLNDFITNILAGR